MSDTPNDDPFAAFGQNRTVIKPSAGRAAPPAPAQSGAGPAAAPAGAGPREAPLALDALMLTASLNPLVAVAMPLLTAAPRIRTSAQHPNPAGLKDALADGVRKFEAQARSQGLPNDQIIAGRYILCTLLDESAASTPWGGSGVWSAHSLLVQFHNESWGGEKVFQLMGKLAENIPANRALLELLYVAIALGFEGRYRVIDNGAAQLESVRTRLAQMLRQGSQPDPALSPRWQGVARSAGGLRASVPLWVIAASVGAVLLLLYGALRLSLNGTSDPVFSALRSLDVKAAPVAAPPLAAPRLANLLKPDIDAGRVSVQDLADRSVVSIKGDGLFDPGSAEIASAQVALISRIADALNPIKGRVLVTGHTDNQPIRSLRFPSNWHLSQTRAESVGKMLAQRIDPARVKVEGRADAEPIDDNSTANGRAHNRRVEVTLFLQNTP